jgi:selenocysteine lyase/cysteine desulfurase
MNDSSNLSDPAGSRRAFLMQGLTALGGAALLSMMAAGAASGNPPALPHRKPQGPDDEAYWRQVRSLFQFEPGFTYLNNGGLGVPLREAVDLIHKGYLRYTEIGYDAESDEMFNNMWSEVRPGAAKLIGADFNEIAIIRNATEGLAAFAHGIDLEPGDEVLMTTHEYPAGKDAWLMKSQRYGIKIREVRIPSPPSSKEEVVEIFRSGITPRTKVMAFCHITRGAGLLYPARELCALAREHGLMTAVDGAQAVGQMPVNVHDIGCDLYTASLHKWALTPAGTGVLYVRKEFHKRFWPLIQGSGGGDWNALDAGAMRYEAIGTHEIPLRSAMAPSLKLLDAIGLDHITARNRLLSNYLKAELAKIPEVRLATSTSEELSSPGITSFSVKKWRGTQLDWLLRNEYRIRVASDQMDDNDLMRISTHFYNTKEEIDFTLSALKTIIRIGHEKLGAG